MNVVNKWQAEYQVEHNGKGGYQVSYWNKDTPSRRYLDELVNIYGVTFTSRRTFRTIDAAKLAATTHANKKNEELCAGELVVYLGVLP